MVFVLLILVVVLALTSGAMYAMLKLNNAEYRAEVARLNCKNKDLESKLAELNRLYRRLSDVREGLN